MFRPANLEPGADLMLLHPDGRGELLVETGSGAVTDPMVSLDGKSVYFACFPDVDPSALNYQRGNLPYLGADLWRIDLDTRKRMRLTHGEFTPNTGAGVWDESNPVSPPPGFNSLGYGILNLGPCPLPGGKIAFTSNRNGFVPPKGYTNPTLQLFVMDEDGRNVTPIAPMSIGSALHPVLLQDGRIAFSSFESQGLRDHRMLGLWAIAPDGRNWAPLVSSFHRGQAFHFMTQRSDGHLVVCDYYNLNNDGFGTLLDVPPPDPALPPFHDAWLANNPPLGRTVDGIGANPFQMAFTPRGTTTLTPMTLPDDQAAPIDPATGARVGKFTHPCAAPGNQLLVCWSPGPANSLDRPTTKPLDDGAICLVPPGVVVDSPDDLVVLKDDPAWNEAWPRAVVPWSAVHGRAPRELPWLPNDGSLHPDLPAGTPYGLVGTSSFWKRESFPGHVVPWSDTFDGLDAFNTYENEQSSNWSWQGGDAGKYDDDDIWAVRVVAMEPNTHRSYGPFEGFQFTNAANERLRILGEIPLLKDDGGGGYVLDAEGNPDSSFLARIPADTPFTFQTLDRDGMVLNMAQTWHQVRPGEVRNDCGGCHAHSQKPLDFATTAAADPGYVPFDLSTTTPLLTRDATGAPALHLVPTGVVDVEFVRDIRPLLQSRCVPCHTTTDPAPPGDLVFDDLAVQDGLPGDYFRLAADRDARFGLPPVTGAGWRGTNASRYVRHFQSRRSLLIWKLFGARRDGWDDADHPTEAVPGDPSTLPPGHDSREADLDYTGTLMPPPGSGVAPLTHDEKLTFVRWIDLGCPLDRNGSSDSGGFGWFLDDLRPTLTVSRPRPGSQAGPLRLIRIGAADANSGVDWATLSVVANFAVDGRAAGDPLADLFVPAAQGIVELRLATPLARIRRGRLEASVADLQGNVTRVDVAFEVR